MPKGLSVTQTSRKMSVSADNRMVSAISFGVFWRRAPFDQGNHAVKKTAAFLDGDTNDNAVAQHAGATRHRAPIAAAFANHRGRFASDGGFINTGDSLNDIAIGGNNVARFADDEVSLLQRRRGNFFLAPVDQAARNRFFPCSAQAGGLGFATAFCNRFGKISEQHREPEQIANCATNPRNSGSAVKIPTVVSAAPTIVTNMTGFLTIRRGFSFLNASPIAGPAIFQSKREGDFCVIGIVSAVNRDFP